MITVNMVTAKAQVHALRRAVRDKSFEPLDRKATVPALAEQAELDREGIRVADAEKQQRIDAATTVSELLEIQNAFGNQ